MCEMGLHGHFDQHGLYMQNKHGRIMIEAPEQEDVYIVKHIAKGLNKFALMSTMHTPSNPEVALPATVLDANSQVQIRKFQAQVEPSSSTETAFLSEKAKTYKLWHRRFAHLGSAKLRNLHKITTLEKPIPIAENKENICEVCAIIVEESSHAI